MPENTTCCAPSSIKNNKSCIALSTELPKQEVDLLDTVAYKDDYGYTRFGIISAVELRIVQKGNPDATITSTPTLFYTIFGTFIQKTTQQLRPATNEEVEKYFQ